MNEKEAVKAIFDDRPNKLTTYLISGCMKFGEYVIATGTSIACFDRRAIFCLLMCCVTKTTQSIASTVGYYTMRAPRINEVALNLFHLYFPDFMQLLMTYESHIKCLFQITYLFDLPL